MRKFLIYVLLTFAFSSCSVSETIEINADGSGFMAVIQEQDEKKSKYLLPNFPLLIRDTIAVDESIGEVIKRHSELFGRMSKVEQELYRSFENVSIKIERNAKQRTSKQVTSCRFTNINSLPNLHNALNVRSNIIRNQAISGKLKAATLKFFYDGKIFRRTVKVLDTAYFSNEKMMFEKYKDKIKDVVHTSNYNMTYKFPKKIASITTQEKATISDDRKQVTMVFSLSDVSRNPEITNFNVVFEN